MSELTKQNDEPKSILRTMANRYGMEPRAFETAVKATLGLDKCSDGQFAAFLAVANEYGLNPLTREIFAFPNKSGGIQPIVSIDGWLNLANSHPMFDGMDFEDVLDQQGCLAAITCRIHRKDRRHSISVTEYMGECKGNTQPWKQWPARMLRHKAAIQAIRYAFGFAGVMDPDEYDRMITVDAQVQKAVKNEPIRIAHPLANLDMHGKPFLSEADPTPEQLVEPEADPYAKASAEREARLAMEQASSEQDK
jgi:phage recombination protein Bet